MLGPEDNTLAQYWYSPSTLRVLTQLCRGCRCIGLLSTPSVYFALDQETQRNTVLFEFDRRWDEGSVNFRFVDYQAPLSDIEGALQGRCDMVIADPPRVMESVVEKYMQVMKVLLAPGGGIALTSAMENEPFLAEEHGLFARTFVPKASAVWAAVGRFRLFTNFSHSCLAIRNEEDFPDDGEADDYSKEQSSWAY